MEPRVHARPLRRNYHSGKLFDTIDLSTESSQGQFLTLPVERIEERIVQIQEVLASRTERSAHLL
jgi:hypothetical protein